MSSGFGLHGTTGRCYPIYRDLIECAADKKTKDEKLSCVPYADDYMECLHHNKEYLRNRAVFATYLSQKKGDKKTTTETAKSHH